MNLQRFFKTIFLLNLPMYESNLVLVQQRAAMILSGQRGVRAEEK
jgi:hypothetical protein